MIQSAFYTVPQAAEYLGVNNAQIYSLCRSSDFPVVVKRIGRHWRINVASLEQWANGY